jgi:hypothetical protein
MTQQSDADDRGDAAAEDVAPHHVHKCKQDLPSEGKADPGDAFGADPRLAQWWPSLHPNGGAPMWMRTDLALLESAFPAFSFTICRGRRGPSFEAWRDTAQSGLYAIITDDPGELWRELDVAPR